MSYLVTITCYMDKIRNDNQSYCDTLCLDVAEVVYNYLLKTTPVGNIVSIIDTSEVSDYGKRKVIKSKTAIK